MDKKGVCLGGGGEERDHLRKERGREGGRKGGREKRSVMK